MSAVGNFFHALWGGVQKALPIAETGLKWASFAGIPYTGVASDLLSKIDGAVVKAEATLTGPGQGSAKSALAQTDFVEQLGLDIGSAILSARGETLTYDKAVFQECLDLKVSIYNDTVKLTDAIERLRKSFGTEKVIKPVPVPIPKP